MYAYVASKTICKKRRLDFGTLRATNDQQAANAFECILLQCITYVYRKTKFNQAPACLRRKGRYTNLCAESSLVPVIPFRRQCI